MQLFNRRIAVVTLLGFSSGLPLALSGGTLQAWITEVGVEITTIGIFSLVGIPYVFKFVWAPILDRYQLGWLGRRRDWTLIAQTALAVLLISIGYLDLASGELAWLGIAALMLAFLSATQDIAIDAYRTEVLEQKERGFGAAVFVAGYRVAMLTAGAGALALADRVGFERVYIVMGMLMGIGVAANLASPRLAATVPAPKTLRAAVVDPLKDFFTRPEALVLLALVFLYKLGEAFAGTLTTTFLLRGLEFSLMDVGIINKGLGIIASIAGALFGGALMYRFGLYRSLLMFAWLQAVTNLGFCLLAITGKSYLALVIVIALENLTGGMGTAAFVALLMALCDPRYTATQFAMLTAVAALGRVLAGPPSGLMVESLGWPLFYFISFIIAVPAILILTNKQRLVARLDAAPPDGRT